jgi:large subunit ribosomal protein L2
LKTFNPTRPAAPAGHGRPFELYKGKPVKALTEGKTGRAAATTRAVSPRTHPRRRPQAPYRMVDFKRRKFDVATVERLEYDPNRTAFIALIKYEDGELAYILAPQRLAAGDKVISGEKVDVKPGNAMPLARCRSARSSTMSR